MNVLELGEAVSKAAYVQEKERYAELNRKAGAMLQWMSLFLGIFNIGIPLLVKAGKIDVSGGQYLGIYVLMLFCSLIAIGGILFATILRKYKYFPNGKDILSEAKTNSKFGNSNYCTYRNILMQDAIANRMRKNNGILAVSLIVAEIMLMLDIVFTVVFVFLVM